MVHLMYLGCQRTFCHKELWSAALLVSYSVFMVLCSWHDLLANTHLPAAVGWYPPG